MLKVDAPYYGTNPYDPALASARQVGTLTFDADSINTATLTYSVDGVQVTKHVQREFWEYENYNGSYVGGIVEDVTNCGTNNGHRVTAGTVTITQVNNTAMTLVTDQLNGAACTYNGAYSQLGHMGSMDGSYSCTDGSAGTFSAYEMEKSVSGMTGRFSSQFGSCTATGHFGGLVQ